jgi:2-haloacid dehalogenase
LYYATKMSEMSDKIDTIIFDLGGVLIDWNPKYLYSQIFKNEEEMKSFFENICTSDWNEEQDAGRSLKKGTEFLVNKYPDHEENIRAFYGRWEEMLKGPIQETVDLFKEIKNRGFRTYALTNWSEETFAIALNRFDFLKWFDGIVVSGTEKTTKPFPEIYKILFDRYNVVPNKAVFIDDNLRNIKAAEKLGLKVIHFEDSQRLKKELEKFNIL